jgi:hypothetical protein
MKPALKIEFQKDCDVIIKDGIGLGVTALAADILTGTWHLALVVTACKLTT